MTRFERVRRGRSKGVRCDNRDNGKDCSVSVLSFARLAAVVTVATLSFNRKNFLESCVYQLVARKGRIEVFEDVADSENVDHSPLDCDRERSESIKQLCSNATNTQVLTAYTYKYIHTYLSKAPRFPLFRALRPVVRTP
ncbi:hypothetical protein V1478_014044 [Vespula squamosa]|uniref:Uncharacterized protein n=1 Tax=Vespula squamosa TaxID=30214 RepID=A0ABD2A6V7_VESSQ